MIPRMGGVRWFALAVAALSVAGASAQRTLAAFPGANGEIAFASQRDGDYEIYVMNPDASEQRPLTDHANVDFDPVWSADGGHLAFVTDRDGNYEIYAMRGDGGGQVRLTSDGASDLEPAWSPDGQRIAFTSSRDGNDEVYAMNADGGAPTRLTTGAALDGNPAWSPDGRWIAFTSDRTGSSQIYVMTAFGAEQTRLTVHPASDVSPNWSPDGKQIAFASNRDGNYEIYVMNADGSGQRRLTRNIAADLDPAWSPDGKELLFTSRRDGNTEIYVMNADGSAQTRLTTNEVEDTTADWQPLAIPPAVVSRASFQVRWRVSVAHGTLNVQGQVGAPATADLVLRQGERVRATAKLEVPAGQFSQAFPLPSTLMPGPYSLDVKPAAGPTPFSPQTIPLELLPPPEGVVSSAYTSAQPGGVPLKRFPPRTAVVFAQFRFFSLPSRGRAVTVSWYRPGGKLAGPRRRKPPSRLVVAYVGGRNGAPLPAGTWRTEIRAGPTVVKRLSFRVG
jgi:WD40-like Beta Propeller Repeat